MWRGVGAKRAATARARARVIVVAAAAAIVLALGLAWARRGADVGPLRMADGAPIAALSMPRAYPLSDGSRIELAEGATFTATTSTASAFEGALRGGTATFDVVPGGPRRWAIDCGLARVEVVGTRFVIDARTERVAVRVERGHVRVRGAQGVTELKAGESVVVEAPRATAIPAEVPTIDLRDLPAATTTATASPTATNTTATADPRWRELARAGDNRAAYDALGAPGVVGASAGATVDDLFALADVARLSGHPTEAIAPLERILGTHAADPRAGMAAFTLGRVELDALSHPARAATAFARAIALGVPGGLLEDAHARLVESRARAGDRAGARAAYEAYLRAFPNGSRAAAMQRWLDDDSQR
jgi:transmembrane sensor